MVYLIFITLRLKPLFLVLRVTRHSLTVNGLKIRGHVFSNYYLERIIL